MRNIPTLEKYHFIVIIENCKVLNDKKENVVANSLMFWNICLKDLNNEMIIKKIFGSISYLDFID